jgi:hypothetical protein
MKKKRIKGQFKGEGPRHSKKTKLISHSTKIGCFHTHQIDIEIGFRIKHRFESFYKSRVEGGFKSRIEGVRITG